MLEVAVDSAEGPDPKDAYLLAMLRAAPGAILVTGDKALLALGQKRICTPRAWSDMRARA